MCGIIGHIALPATNESDTRIGMSWVVEATKLLHHRGPDAHRVWMSSNGKVTFGHTRLAIQDLSSEADQPFVNYDHQISLVFNGEIYNFKDVRDKLERKGHKFRTNSDTEVLLIAYLEWNSLCLEYLNGMFAFAIYDQVRNSLFCARDRAGEKPFYYFADKKGFLFASELKALLKNESLPRKIDSLSLDCYLSHGYVAGSDCILHGYRKLPAGHALQLSLDTGAIKTWRYWQVTTTEMETKKYDIESLATELENRLERAIGLQLCADVPVAMLLSGGVDSSILVALASRQRNAVKTYSVSFPGFSTHDESPYFNRIADHFKTDHTVLKADSVTDSILDVLGYQVDEPIIDSSLIPTYLLTKSVSEQCKVAIGGDGGDELFGGYFSASRVSQLNSTYKRIPRVARYGAGLASRLMPIGSTGSSLLSHLAADPKTSLPIFMQKFDRRWREYLVDTLRGLQTRAEDVHRARIPLICNPINRLGVFEFQNYLCEDILVKVDRSSMANSVEVRAPFLDRSVIDFAFNEVPSELKANNNERKILLKILAKRLLPADFDVQRKQGFSIPLKQWLLRGTWRRRVEEILLDKAALFNPKAIHKLFKQLDSGFPVSEQLFGLCIFEVWRHAYKTGL